MVAANVDGANVPAVPEGVGPLHQPPSFEHDEVERVLVAALSAAEHLNHEVPTGSPGPPLTAHFNEENLVVVLDPLKLPVQIHSVIVLY